jgi:hypothetical protein
MACLGYDGTLDFILQSELYIDRFAFQNECLVGVSSVAKRQIYNQIRQNLTFNAT